MKTASTLTLLLALSTVGFCQKFTVEKGFVSFFSHAAIEDISAKNEHVSGIFNAANNEIVFSVTISEFKFAKSLMQEHFNEKYMESDKFPKATFQGKITGFDNQGSGVQTAKAVGKFSIHGVEKSVDIPGTIEKSGNGLLFKSKFIVKLEDYNIQRPQMFWKNIAEQVEVTVDLTFKAQ